MNRLTIKKATAAICLLLTVPLLFSCGNSNTVAGDDTSSNLSADGVSIVADAVVSTADASAKADIISTADAAITANEVNGTDANTTGSISANVALNSASKVSIDENAASVPTFKELTYDITLGFAGDVNFADNYGPVQNMKAIGAASITEVIHPEVAQAMNSMDLMWLNNEFAYSDRGAPMNGKKYTFCAEPSHATWLHDLGVDIVGLANNHVFDYGAEAFEDTLATLETEGIPYVGAGRNLEQAMAPVYLQAGDFTIAYVAASRAEKYKLTPQATDTEGGILRCYDNALFLQSIKEAAANADYVIALPHWGTEYSTVLETAQTEGAKEYIEAGADAVIGAHPHILQGIQYVEGKPVVYSLGNFWFNNRDQNTMIAVIHLTGTYMEGTTPDIADAEISLQLLPGTQRNYETTLATDPADARRILDDIQDISIDVTIDDNGYVHPLDSES